MLILAMSQIPQDMAQRLDMLLYGAMACLGGGLLLLIVAVLLLKRAGRRKRRTARSHDDFPMS